MVSTIMKVTIFMSYYSLSTKRACTVELALTQHLRLDFSKTGEPNFFVVRARFKVRENRLSVLGILAVNLSLMTKLMRDGKSGKLFPS